MMYRHIGIVMSSFILICVRSTVASMSSDSSEGSDVPIEESTDPRLREILSLSRAWTPEEFVYIQTSYKYEFDLCRHRLFFARDSRFGSDSDKESPINYWMTRLGRALELWISILKGQLCLSGHTDTMRVALKAAVGDAYKIYSETLYDRSKNAATAQSYYQEAVLLAQNIYPDNQHILQPVPLRAIRDWLKLAYEEPLGREKAMKMMKQVVRILESTVSSISTSAQSLRHQLDDEVPQLVVEMRTRLNKWICDDAEWCFVETDVDADIS